MGKMIKVQITKQSNYPVSSVKIRKVLQDFFTTEGIVSDALVSVAIVGELKMRELGHKFLGEDGTVTHNVLSFVPSESSAEFVYPDDNVVQLGEIVVCFPIAFEEAKKEGVSIEKKVIELLTHGGGHLLGRHHN